MDKRHVILGILLAAGALASCKRAAPATPHESLSSLDPIRAAFNADSGKVRAIFLASPT
jgi:hypothetical protein